jgi:TPR repeat protein
VNHCPVSVFIIDQSSRRFDMKRWAIFASLPFWVFCRADLAMAGHFQAGVLAFKNADYADALKDFSPLTTQSHPEAQYDLSIIYRFGLVGKPDYAKAVEWSAMAATNGYAPGQYMLGDLYYRGEGVVQNYVTAAHWWLLAAEQNDVDAQHGLAFLYSFGQGVPQDMKKSAYWDHRAAERGSVSGQIGLGFSYALGNGVPRNYQKAYKWLNLAASRLPSGKTYELVSHERDLMASKLTKNELARIQALVESWQPQK